MSDLLGYLRFRAVEERVPEARLRNLLAEAESGKIDGVYVDQEHHRILVDCILKEGELSMVYPEVRADFVRISVAEGERGPRIGVLAENGRDVEPFLKKTQKGDFLIFVFRNGIVFRCWQGNGGCTVAADYVGVRYEGSRAFVVCVPRFELGIPQFAADGDLQAYLQTVKVPEEYFGIVARLVGTGGPKARVLNEQWVSGLQKAKEPMEKSVDDSSNPDSGSRPRRSKNKERQRTEGHKPRPKLPEEDVPHVQPGASSKDFVEESKQED